MNIDKSYKYSVQPHDVDFTGRITLYAMGNYLLHAAGVDADNKGYGVRMLQPQGLSWVLSRMSIELSRLPMEYDEFMVETWVENIGRMTTTRNFIIYDKHDEIIGGGSTYWAMINLDTRRAQDMSGNPDYQRCIDPQRGIVDAPCRIHINEGAKHCQHTVLYSDLDFNHHANSMKYLQWILDTLPLEVIIGDKISRIDLNFMHEVVYGEVVDIYFEGTDTQYKFDFRREGISVCRIQMTLKAD